MREEREISEGGERYGRGRREIWEKGERYERKERRDRGEGERPLRLLTLKLLVILKRGGFQ